MELYTSETIADTSNTSTNNEISLSFDIENGGTETVYVEDKLLTNYEVAKARAESIFLDEGYINKRVTFTTYHIDNLHIGDSFQLDGLLFKAISIRNIIKGAKVSMEITGERVFLGAVADVTIIFATADKIQSVASFNGYMYGASQIDGRIYKSYEGTIWTMVYDDSTHSDVKSIYSNGSYICAIMQLSGTGSKVIKSADGSAWESVLDLPSHYGGVVTSFNGNMYVSAYLTLYTSKIYKSSNGTDWADVEDIDSIVTSMCEHDGSLLVSGYFYDTGVLKTNIYSSSDGEVYAKLTTELYEILGVTSHGGYVYGVDYSGYIRRSIDGDTWEVVLNNPSYEMYNIEIHKTGLYTPTYDGTIVYSPNGTTWSEVYTVPDFTSFLWAIHSHGEYLYFFDWVSNCYKLLHSDGE